MKYCVHCGKPMEDNARFCFACGKEVGTAPTPAVHNETAAYAEEKECLDNFYKIFKWERIAWKVNGIVSLVMAIVFIGYGLLFALVGLSAEDGFFSIFGLIYAFVAAIVILPVAIVNLKMVKRAEYYMNTLYADPAGMVKRAGEVGMIVLSAIFNQYAMICIIINFVRVKTNKAVLDRIIARQSTYRNGGM